MITILSKFKKLSSVLFKSFLIYNKYKKDPPNGAINLVKSSSFIYKCPMFSSLNNITNILIIFSLVNSILFYDHYKCLVKNLNNHYYK